MDCIGYFVIFSVGCKVVEALEGYLVICKLSEGHVVKLFGVLATGFERMAGREIGGLVDGRWLLY